MGSLQKLLISVRSSLWWLPALIIFGSMLLAFGLIWFDASLQDGALQEIPWLFGAQADGSRGMLTAIATSMITVAGVTFSITMSALAQASSQYSPLILRNFMQDRANQVVLGVFGGIFVYSLVVLRSVRSDPDGFVPGVAVMGALVYAVVSIGFLLYFINHIANVLQASSILAMVGSRTLAAIDDLFPHDAEPGEDQSETSRDEAAWLRERTWFPVLALSTGYIQAVRMEAMVEIACDQDAVVRMEHGVGAFVIRGLPIISVAMASAPDDAVRSAFADAFVIGEYRNIDQDPEFGVRQIVDMAVKALSPGINDPTTACSCLDYLGAILVRVVSRRLTTPERYHDGELRVLVIGPTFESFSRLTFDQIRQSSSNDRSVLECMVATIGIVGQRSIASARRRILLHHLGLISEHAQDVLRQSADREMIVKRIAEARRSIAGPDDRTASA